MVVLGCILKLKYVYNCIDNGMTVCYIKNMERTPNVSIRFTREQHEWVIKYVEENNTNLNAFVKELVNERMLDAKNYQSIKKF